MSEVTDAVETKFNEQSDFPKLAEELSTKKRKESHPHIPSVDKRKYGGMKAQELRSILSSDIITFCQDLKLLATSVTCFCGDEATLVNRRETNDGCFWSC
uniref:BLTX460 n=1 Tax=Nephila pilipes TaxID=299642 RepID=A0A076KZM8_NEPPI|nr:BLTX460 [Nephila pilipes]